jgi:GT2 family glycosyltransferase
MITETRAEPTLSVSIVLHNSNLELLRATINSLQMSVEVARGALHHPVPLRLVDNQSDDEYRAALDAELPSLRAGSPALAIVLDKNPENSGFGAGHNRALGSCDSDYYLILNPDIELEPEALLRAIGYLQGRPEVVALNPRGERDDGSREYLCKRYPSLLGLLLRGLPWAGLRRLFSARLARYEYRDLDDMEPCAVCLLSGACLLCRRSSFEAVGGFDTRFFMYFEDFDLSRRLARLGALAYLPGMRVLHHGGFAARKGRRHIQWFVRSALRFFHLHGWQLL